MPIISATKAAIQEQITRADARLCRLPQQPLEHAGQGIVTAHRREGHREASAFLDDVGRGVGVEVTGAALGLTAVDLAGVVQRFTVVGDEGEVDGQRLTASA